MLMSHLYVQLFWFPSVHPLSFSGCTRKRRAPRSQRKPGQCHFNLFSMLSHKHVLFNQQIMSIGTNLGLLLWVIVKYDSLFLIWPSLCLAICSICHHFIIFCLSGSPRRARTSRSAGNPRNSGETEDSLPVSHTFCINFLILCWNEQVWTHAPKNKSKTQ